jgi:transcriptional regulator with XRE-family HTH domain
MAKRNNRLKVLRAERDLTQEQLAKLLHMTRDRYLRIEHETTLPTPDERRRMVLVLNEFAQRRQLAGVRVVTETSTGLSVDPRGATRGPRPQRRGRSRAPASKGGDERTRAAAAMP